MKNTSFDIFPSAARTAAELYEGKNSHGSVLHVTLDITAASGSPSITLKIQAKDKTSGKWYDLLVGAAKSGVSTTTYRIGPALTPIANLVANDHLPEDFRVVMQHSTTDSITYSVGGRIIV